MNLEARTGIIRPKRAPASTSRGVCTPRAILEYETRAGIAKRGKAALFLTVR